MDRDRRGMLACLGRGLLGLWGVGGTILAARFVLPPPVEDRSRRLLAGNLGTLPAGATLYLPDPDVHLFHGPDGLYALSGRCTHLGCSLLRQAEGFSCPCHGARFDEGGRPLSGPATRPLHHHLLELDGRGQIWLRLDRTVAPGTLLRVS